MDHVLQWIQTCKNFVLVKQKFIELVAFNSQSCPEVRLLILAATATETSNLWDVSVTWKLFLAALCCHKIN